MDARESVLTAKRVMIAQSSVGITLLSTCLVLQLIGFKEKYPKLQLRKRVDQTILHTIGVIACALTYQLTELSMYAHNWIGNDAGCSLTSRPFIPFLFVLSKMFLYYFMYIRASLILDTLRLQNRLVKGVRYALVFAIWIGIPACFWWTFFLVFDAVVFLPEGTCVLIAAQIAPILAFAVLDVVLSLTLLFLFAYPLHGHLKRMKQESVESELGMFKVLRRNMILSTLITFSTSSNLIAMVVLLIYHSKDAPREEANLQIYAHFFPSADMFISSMLMLLLSSSWMPKFLADRFVLKTDDGMTRSKSKPVTKDDSKKDDTKDISRRLTVTSPGSTVINTL